MAEIIIPKGKIMFPEEVEALLYALHRAGFFSHGLLIGSWVFPIYREAFDIHYALKTFDIDFAVDTASKRIDKIDLEKIITGLGYLPVLTMSGVQKFTRKGFEIEFLIHREGGKETEKVDIRHLNITATPLPFLAILFQSPIPVDLIDYQVMIPCPEALFIHKLIVAQKRRQRAKADKDLEQCKALVSGIDREKLNQITAFLKFSSRTRRMIQASCEANGFPPHLIGI